MKLQGNQKVKIYYNDVDIEQTPYRILPGCKYVEHPWRQSIEFADQKVQSGEWKNYLIPDLTGAKVIFEDNLEEELDDDMIYCPHCSASEEFQYEEKGGMTNFTKMLGHNTYLCHNCEGEFQFNLEEIDDF